jgi:hypothetical protein
VLFICTLDTLLGKLLLDTPEIPVVGIPKVRRSSACSGKSGREERVAKVSRRNHRKKNRPALKTAHNLTQKASCQQRARRQGKSTRPQDGPESLLSAESKEAKRAERRLRTR